MPCTRTLFALLIAGLAVAVEPATIIPLPAGAEVYVLADGRRLIGTYDPVSGLLRVVGAVPAVIRVELESIVARRPANAADLPDDRPSTPQERAQRSRAAATGALAASHRASAERETMLTIARRRQAEAEARATAAGQGVLAADAVVAGISEQRREVQGHRDHVANQRALTDLRVRETIVTHPGGGVHPAGCVIDPAHPADNGLPITQRELSAELSAADGRLAELDLRLAGLDRRLAAAQGQRADRLGQQLAAQTASAEQTARIAALSAQQAQASDERARFAAVLARDPAPGVAAP